MPNFHEIESVLQQASSQASEYLRQNADPDSPVIQCQAPAQLERLLKLELPERGRPLKSLLVDMQDFLEHSVHVGHPRFLNQLFGGQDAAGILGEWMTAVLNTSMYTYESAPVGTLVELKLIDEMNAAVGFTHGDGVMAPGGSISNLMALLCARHVKFPGVKEQGLPGGCLPSIFHSDQAHYSIPRAAAVAGLGTKRSIPVASDAEGRMRPDALRVALQQSKARGETPFFVVATAGTTVPGAYDPIEPIARVAQEHELWLHVDASYGGSVLLSEKHRHLMAGVGAADSVTWNPHKMMGVPLACSAILMREKGVLLATNGMGAEYLFHDALDGTSYNLGDLSLQCGRRVDAFKLWFSWQVMGRRGYQERVDHLFQMSADFAAMIEEREDFELAREPHGPNVCFRYLPAHVHPKTAAQRLAWQGQATQEIRAKLMQDGRFMINYASLDGVSTFRNVSTNPETSHADLQALLDAIEELGSRLSFRPATRQELAR